MEKIDYKSVNRKNGKICNSNIQRGGDCWGDSYCTEGKQTCNHKDFVCAGCAIKFCGCCYSWRREKCPSCGCDWSEIADRTGNCIEI